MIYKAVLELKHANGEVTTIEVSGTDAHHVAYLMNKFRTFYSEQKDGPQQEVTTSTERSLWECIFGHKANHWDIDD